MGFFNALKHLLGADSDHHQDHPKLAAAWGLDNEPVGEGFESSADSTDYDRVQWVRKLKRVLEKLPASEPEWSHVAAEARALHLDPAWVAETEKNEFLLLIRKAVSDRRLSQDEHAKIDLARKILGIPEEEAEAALVEIVDEARSFFQTQIKGI